MDEVFKAIGDPGRRRLLDALFVEDGQTLGALCSVLPDMTRQGVMSHLSILEEAGLVTTRRSGREKHHYLNPVPIRLIHDRWIGKYAGATAAHLVAVKRSVEGGAMSTPTHVYTVYVAGSAEDVWSAIVDGDRTVQYFYGTRVESTWEPGAPVRYTYPDGTVAADGEVISIDPGTRLEYTFHARWDPDLDAEGPVRQIWRIDPAGDGVVALTVETWDIGADTRTIGEFSSGISYILSGLKTLVETGAPLGG